MDDSVGMVTATRKVVAVAAPGTGTVTLSLEGLHCDDCIEKVRGALLDVPGVSGAEVDVLLASVHGHQLSPTSLVAAVASVGKKAVVQASALQPSV